MEIDKTVRTVSNLLKNLENRESCKLVNICSRTTVSKHHLEKLVDEFRSRNIFTCKTDDELRSLHLLLVLNANIGILEELESNPDIGHAIGVIPPLSVYAYLTFCVEFNLIKYLKEVVEYCPLTIIIHIVESINANLKYLSPKCYFDVLASLLAALFSRFRKTEGATIPQTLYDNSQMLLLNYKEDETATDFDSRFSCGCKWLSLIRLLCAASQICFSPKWKSEPAEVYDIKMQNEIPCGETNKSKAMEEFYDRISYKCRAFADILDMNLFMAWHEIEEDGSTLQNVIGIEAYKLRMLLEKYQSTCTLPAVSSELIEILKSVQRIPDNNAQIIEHRLDIDELEERIRKDVEFDANFVVSAETLLNDEANALSFELTKTFINKLSTKNVSGVTEERIRNLIYLLLGRMEFGQISTFVGEYIACHGVPNILYQSSVDLSFQFEKMNGTTIDDEESCSKIFKEIILLVFSSAPLVLTALVKEACCADQNKRCKIVDLLRMLKTVCLYEGSDLNMVQPLLFSAVKNFFENVFQQSTVVQRYNFFELINIFCDKDLIDESSLLCTCLLRSLDVRENVNWQILSELLVFLKKFLKREKLRIDLRPLLLQLFHVIEAARCNASTFIPERLKACEEAIDAIELVREMLPAADYSTAIEAIQVNHADRFSDLTRLYLLDSYPSTRNCRIESILMGLIRAPLQQDVECFLREYEQKEATFTLRMGELLPRLTPKEFHNIVKNYGAGDARNFAFILDIISDGLSFVAYCAAEFATVAEANDAAIIGCVGQIVNNFLLTLESAWPFLETSDYKFCYVRYVTRLAAALKRFPGHLVRPYVFNLIKFVDDSIDKMKLAEAGSAETNEVMQNFHAQMQRLAVGLFLLLL